MRLVCKFLAFFLFVSIFLAGCSPTLMWRLRDGIARNPAEGLVVAVRAVHGSEKLTNSIVDFDFRNRHFKIERRGGVFTYERSYRDDQGRLVQEFLKNEGVSRVIDGQPVSLSERDQDALPGSINSVVYFAMLPFNLTDPAVRPEYLGVVKIKGQDYYKLKVTFQQEGGGSDFEDTYIYWIHKEKLTIDYLAYNYQVNGGGARFREAINVRTINDVRFADYINYEPTTETLDVANFDRMFIRGELKELSRILTENVTWKPLEGAQDAQ